MDYPVEAGLTSLNAFTESKHFDRLYDKATGKAKSDSKVSGYSRNDVENDRPRSGVGRHRNTLPSPERDPESNTGRRYRDHELEAQSETSERVLRAYENERDDPKRRPTASLIGSTRSRDSRRDSGTRMSYANDGNGYARSERPASQPPRSRYYEDDEDSDYDERTGRRLKATGRGYDAERDREFDREIVETERYRGPARDYDPRRQQHFNNPYESGPYQPGATGAMAPYRRSQADLASRRSKSHSRRDRSYSRSQSRSRSRDREQHDGIRGKFDETFDTSLQGVGIGIAGALVGGLAGREFGGPRSKKRDMILGALIGGLGANAAENKYKDFEKGRREKDAIKYEENRDGGDGKSRSNVR